ncbi:AMP-binding protein [Bizionia saleffrena]|uniref:AMP-binding protein n=1 Tax=Bizionia saleffrena TaxID=291189 RepID=A0A8H2LB39_9FLAO|nr:AMP-binding protein [Bizionia saleffrena]TYB69463.1 AMP-binding protein [Bizionia saleffrena]
MEKYKIYESLPFFLQNLACTAKGLSIKRKRQNSSFYSHLLFYEKSFKFSNESIINYQKKQLFRLLNEAKKSDYWKRKFEKYELNINSEINVFEELKKLPLLSKEDVFYNREEILTTNIKKLNQVKTGGTTGKGLTFWETDEALNKQWAIWWRYRRGLGIDLNTWCGWFGGKEVVPPNPKEKKFYRVNYFGKQIMFSQVHLSTKNVKIYYEVIKDKQLSWLHGYPSQLALLAALILESNLKPIPSLKIITIGAEGITKEQKNIIEKAFKIKVYQHYGLSEKVANISENLKGELIPDNDFAFIEYIHIEDDKYKLIGTNFSNIAFPLIRYDTGDIVKLNEQGQITEIEGREADYITLPNGNRFGPMNLLFKVLSNVIEAQLYIKSEREYVFRIVRGANYVSDIEETKILKEVDKRITDKSISLSFEYLDKLPRTKSGKLKSIAK